MRINFIVMTLLFSLISLAQTTISGKVTDASSIPVAGVNVSIVGSSSSTISDFDGFFTLKTDSAYPITLEAQMMGYSSQTIVVNSKDDVVAFSLTEESTKLNEIVVSASRTPERVIESPVTIERMGLKEIKNTTAPSFYEGLENLKDVHFNTSSFSFKSINTRGFATIANTRFMQLVDGMDNASPALNFVLGNLIGISDIDVANVEVLPGASSALYGANAFNGIMFMNSRSPFTKEGISIYGKVGSTTQTAAGTNNFYDFGVRAAKKFSDELAGKANFTYLTASEWIAADTRNFNTTDRTLTSTGVGHAVNQNYDGLNLYGDEVSTFIPNVGQVSRTGYREQDLTDNKIESVKADFSLHYKPGAKDVEIILQHKLGFGNTIYQGANRYALKNFFMNQSRIEVKGKNFFARVYRSAEDAGDSYDMRFAAWNVNRAAKSDTEWFTNYATAFQVSGATGLATNSTQQAMVARQYADYNTFPTGFTSLYSLPQFTTAPTGSPRFEAGSAEFNSALSKIISNPDLTEGAKFKDRTQLFHSDLNYNLKDVVKFAEIQVGGSARRYRLNSEGSIFTDNDGPITYDEYGVYTQVQKKFMDDKIKFTGSIRYDKAELFDGNFSPRVSLTYAAGSNKQHNFRASYQTGFRNPTTQDLYIGLDLGPFALIGSAADNLNRFSETRNISTLGQGLGQGSTVTLNGNSAYNNSFSLSSVQAFSASGNPALLKAAEINMVKPEQVQAVELGYRSVVEKMSIDISGYYNKYKNFISQERVITPYYGLVGTPLAAQAIVNGDRRVYQVYTNSTADISSYGVGVGVSRKVYKDFELGVSYNFSDFEFDKASDPDFAPGFNTPKHRVKGSIGNDKLFKDFGFNTNVRWNTEYFWESSFADGMVPENIVFDAQITYALRKFGTVFKLGGANIAGKDYLQVIGAGNIGRQYYVSLTFKP